MTSTREIIRVLKRARKLIDKPGRWGKPFGVDACDSLHRAVVPDDPSAVRFGITGATWLASVQLKTGCYGMPADAALMFGLRAQTLRDWNNHPRRTHKQALALLDRTIARLEGKSR